MHKLFRLILACSLVCIGCACTAFAYSPGEGWQDITVTGSAPYTVTTSYTSGSFPYIFYSTNSATSYTARASGSVSSSSPFTSTLSASIASTLFAGTQYPGLGYYGTELGDTAFPRLTLSVPVDTPYFVYTSGTLGGEYYLKTYDVSLVQGSFYIQFELTSYDGLDVVTTSRTTFGYQSRDGIMSFTVSGIPSNMPYKVTKVIVSWGGIERLNNMPNAGHWLSMLHLANGDLSLDDIPPPEPPQNPEHGGSLSSFTVPVKPTGNYTNLMYYEDIVNGLYNAAIDLEAYSFAEYPYTTVISYSASDGYMYYALICTDHPFISDVQVAMEYVNYGTYDFGFSSTVFMCRVPLNAAANTKYTFYAMSSYSAISAVEFIQNLNNTVKFPSADVSAADFYLSSPICSIMSYESGEPVLYTMCCNYAVGNQDTDGRVYLKQSFKYADSWAYLLLQAGNDGADMSAILQQILDTLRSTDTTVTVYQRLNQIYELMSDTSGLPADSPIVGAIGQSTDTMNAFVSQMEVPDLSEITSFSAQISPVLEDIHNSMGLFAVLAGIGIMLGIIKLVLQR